MGGYTDLDILKSKDVAISSVVRALAGECEGSFLNTTTNITLKCRRNSKLFVLWKGVVEEINKE